MHKPCCAVTGSSSNCNTCGQDSRRRFRSYSCQKRSRRSWPTTTACWLWPTLLKKSLSRRSGTKRVNRNNGGGGGSAGVNPLIVMNAAAAAWGRNADAANALELIDNMEPCQATFAAKGITQFARVFQRGFVRNTLVHRQVLQGLQTVGTGGRVNLVCSIVPRNGCNREVDLTELMRTFTTQAQTGRAAWTRHAGDGSCCARCSRGADIVLDCDNSEGVLRAAGLLHTLQGGARIAILTRRQQRELRGRRARARGVSAGDGLRRAARLVRETRRAGQRQRQDHESRVCHGRRHGGCARDDGRVQQPGQGPTCGMAHRQGASDDERRGDLCGPGGDVVRAAAPTPTCLTHLPSTSRRLRVSGRSCAR
ncbi:hypothetical protein JKP88DRAFT_262294 [Tribonema minus]|uniref:Uncharacterized protein n=1 Tax=Tribonema minus TaxID=303371 RepID=A0A835Z8V4_9STRA|nr:hypothetical protein JKP88DRAFT_262294 [Tribonema minus]